MDSVCATYTGKKISPVIMIRNWHSVNPSNLCLIPSRKKSIIVERSTKDIISCNKEILSKEGKALVWSTRITFIFIGTYKLLTSDQVSRFTEFWYTCIIFSLYQTPQPSIHAVSEQIIVYISTMQILIFFSLTNIQIIFFFILKKELSWYCHATFKNPVVK